MLGCTFLWESVSVGGSLTGADHVNEYLNGSPAAHLVTQQEPATPELGSISRYFAHSGWKLGKQGLKP